MSFTRKTFYPIIACLVLHLAVNIQANAETVTVALDLPADGNYTPADFPTVSTQVNVNGATFEIEYTLSAVSNDTGVVVGVAAGQVGVGSDNDINPNHFNTLEGNGAVVPQLDANGDPVLDEEGNVVMVGLSGEGLSFTGLAITNFQANGSGVTAADITDLQLNGLTVTAVANRFDNAAISFLLFGFSADSEDIVRQTLSNNVEIGTGGLNPFEIPLKTQAVFDPLATDLFTQPDTGAPANRWAVSGLSVTFEFDGTLELLGDFDLSGTVDLADLDQYNGNIGAAATGVLEALDLNGDGTVGADDFEQHYSTLVETSNEQTGALQGDANLDGTVDVLNDAFALIGNINAPATSWADGDFTADGLVDVLNDAFALIGNLGSSTDP